MHEQPTLIDEKALAAESPPELPREQPGEIMGDLVDAGRRLRDRAIKAAAPIAMPGIGGSAERRPGAMLRFVRLDPRTLRRSPVAALALALAVAAGLMLVPARWSAVMRGRAAMLLRPGQAAVGTLREHGGRLLDRAKSYYNAAAKLAQVEREREQLEADNRRLAAELALAQNRPAAPEQGPGELVQPLLTARCVRARVLGQLARAYLGRHHLLDVGDEAGVEPDALVVRGSPGLIDQGRDAGVEPGRLVLSGGRVWGKVVEVGPLTSVVRTATEPGYRDLVQLGKSGPQGILEGTGEPLARIRLVEVTEPVADGDVVYAAAGKGFLPEPLVYGTIVRVERPVGAAHWDLWMEPAVDSGAADEVAVIGIELNPVRVGSREWRVGSGEWRTERGQ
jgi:cell shape-determining protein MreC